MILACLALSINQIAEFFRKQYLKIWIILTFHLELDIPLSNIMM